MTRVRSSHDFHEEMSDIEGSSPSFCSNCGLEKTKVCKWCGKCYECHKGVTEENNY